MLFVRSDEEGAKGFTVRCRHEKFLGISESELRGSRDVGAGVWGYVSWVNDVTVKLSTVRSFCNLQGDFTSA
jgi:hypothetical protein